MAAPTQPASRAFRTSSRAFASISRMGSASLRISALICWSRECALGARTILNRGVIRIILLLSSTFGQLESEIRPKDLCVGRDRPD